MADIENNKRSFEVDGIELRSKEKPINENSVYSQTIIVDAKSSAKIFLHSDGQLYFKDNEIKNPIPLSKVENIYERIRFEDGELRFYDKDASGYVSLSQMNSNKLSFQKNNSEIFSSSKALDPGSFDAKTFFEGALKTIPSQTITGSAFEESEIEDAKDIFKTAFSTYTIDELGITTVDALLENYLTGILDPRANISGADTPLTLAQVQELGFDSFEDYASGKEVGKNVGEEGYIWPLENYIIPNKAIFLGDEQIGLKPQTGDKLGRIYFAGKTLREFFDYLTINLFKYDGVKKFLLLLYDAPQVPEFSTTPMVLSGGIFEPPISDITTFVLEETAKALMINLNNKFLTEFQIVLENANLLNNNIFRPADEIISIPSMYLLAQEAVDAMDTPTFRTELLSVIDSVFSDESSTIIVKNTLFAFDVGGMFDSSNFLPFDLLEFNENWYDFPDDMYVVSPIVSNKNAITLSAHFAIGMSPKKSTRYEFRLIDTVSGIELDRVQIESSDTTSFGFPTKDMENNAPSVDPSTLFKTGVTVHPIQLSYFGPMPEFSCSESILDECFAEGKDVLTHIKILSDDCVNANPIGEQSKYRNISDRFFENITTGLDNGDNLIQIDTPRIFKIQWRVIYLDENYSTNVHFQSISSISLSPIVGKGDIGEATTSYGEARMSMSIYNIGSSEGSSNLVRNGVVQFNDEDRKSVSFEFPISTDKDYSISLCCSKNINVWYESKTSNGVTIRAEKAFTGEVSWIFSRKQELQNTDDAESKFPICLVDTVPSYGSRSNFDILRDEGYDI
jgi:hypothetical protein